MSNGTMPRRKRVPSPVANWATSTVLPDGRQLEDGDEFTVVGFGRFRLMKVRPNGELTAWGPIPRNGVVRYGSTRTFSPEAVGTIHRTPRDRATLTKLEEQ